MARRGAEAQARPARHARLPHERLVPALGRRAAGGHLVREARHLEHRPAPVRALRSTRPSARPGRRAPTGTSSCAWPSRSRGWPSSTSACARDLVAAPLLHDTPDELAAARRPGRATGGRRVRADPGPDDAEADPGRARLRRCPRQMTALGPLVETLGTALEGRRLEARRARSTSSACATAACAAGRPTGGRRWSAPTRSARRSSRCRAPPTGASRSRASARWRSAPATTLADLAAERADERITYEDTQIQPRKVIASAEWSGIESRERRYSPFTINVEREMPVAHAHRAPALLRRPPVDARVRRGPAGLPAAAQPGPPPRLRRASTTGSPRSRCATSPRTPSGRSTRPTRTTCTCSTLFRGGPGRSG